MKADVDFDPVVERLESDVAIGGGFGGGTDGGVLRFVSGLEVAQSLESGSEVGCRIAVGGKGGGMSGAPCGQIRHAGLADELLSIFEDGAIEAELHSAVVLTDDDAEAAGNCDAIEPDEWEEEAAPDREELAVRWIS